MMKNTSTRSRYRPSPGVVAQAATVEEAISLAKEAIELHLEGMLADGEAIPEEELRPQAITLEIQLPEREPLVGRR